MTSLFLFATLIALNDMYLFGEPVAVYWRLAFWNANAVMAVALWLGLFLGAIRLQCWLKRDLIVPSAVLIAVMVTVLTLVNQRVIAAIILDWSDIWQRPVVPEILRYVLVALVFEVMTAVFLMPRFFERRAGRKTGRATAPKDASGADAGQDDPPQTENADPSVIVHNGHSINLSRLLYMKSVEHYVELVTHEGTELIRASLRELAELCPPSQGVRPHRSYWVHRDAIVGLNRAEGAQFLVLSNGAEIPVARSQRSAVNTWLNAHFGLKKTRA